MCLSMIGVTTACLLAATALVGGDPGPAAPAVRGSARYEDLVWFFREWRNFQKPKRIDGVPDYTAGAMAGHNTGSAANVFVDADGALHLRIAEIVDEHLDGQVSFEVDPTLAHDQDGTIAEAKRLHRLVDRQNLYIKIPATKPGLGAIEATIAAGIPVESPAWGVNQLCGSGLRTVALGYQALLNGDSEIVVAGGQESMSMAPHAQYLRSGVKMGGEQETVVDVETFGVGFAFGPWLDVTGTQSATSAFSDPHPYRLRSIER